MVAHFLRFKLDTKIFFLKILKGLKLKVLQIGMNDRYDTATVTDVGVIVLLNKDFSFPCGGD